MEESAVNVSSGGQFCSEDKLHSLTMEIPKLYHHRINASVKASLVAVKQECTSDCEDKSSEYLEQLQDCKLDVSSCQNTGIKCEEDPLAVNETCIKQETSDNYSEDMAMKHEAVVLCDKTEKHELTATVIKEQKSEPLCSEHTGKDTVKNPSLCLSNVMGVTGNEILSTASTDLDKFSTLKQIAALREEIDHKGQIQQEKQLQCQYSCSFCKKSFKKRNYLKMHKCTYTGKRLLACKVCKKSFTRPASLRKHMKQTHKSDRPLLCNVCNKSFKLFGNLVRHVRIHSDYQPYTCKICNKSFSDLRYLNMHNRKQRGFQPYQCKICNELFCVRENFKVHMRTHKVKLRVTLQLQNICETCNKSFKRLSCLKSHVFLHTGQRPFTCHICNKSFARNGTLTAHIRTHSGLRPYTCEICNKSFLERGTLKKHSRTHTNIPA